MNLYTYQPPIERKRDSQIPPSGCDVKIQKHQFQPKASEHPTSITSIIPVFKRRKKYWRQSIKDNENLRRFLLLLLFMLLLSSWLSLMKLDTPAVIVRLTANLKNWRCSHWTTFYFFILMRQRHCDWHRVTNQVQQILNINVSPSIHS